MEPQIIRPIQSPNDDRQYQILRLQNQLQIVLVHDPKIQKSACALSVGMGSLRDGQISFGLAHFLQHMLFMGSRKFPRHNEYSEFMSMNSGYDNAYTTDQETNYYFQIANPRFAQGVERITDFFVYAKLSLQCIQKERQAVHEQFKLACGQDNARKWQILKIFASGPYHNHSYGHNNTLSHPDVAQHLRQLYNTQYSANKIKASVVTALPLNTVKQQFLPFFREIQNKSVPESEFEQHFQQKNLGKLVRMQSIRDEAILEFYWAIQSDRPHYKHHISSYISHVLGHQAENSLLSLLKQKQFSSQLSSYCHELPRQNIVGLQIKLTQHGQENYQQVYNLVVDYCSWLRAQPHIYQELQQTNTLAFRFKQKTSARQYVTELTSAMHRVPLTQILNYSYHYEQYDANIINHYLQQLNPFNLILIYSLSQQLENPLTEKYMGTKYLIQALPQRSPGQSVFKTIPPNPFLPVDTSLLQQGSMMPSSLGNVLFAKGDFGVCKGGIKVRVNSPETDSFLTFYGKYLQLLLKELIYHSQCLNLQVNINSQMELSIGIFGFNHTAEQLITKISQLAPKAHKTQQGQQIFQLCLQNLMQQYNNFYENETDEIMTSVLQVITHSGSSTVEQAIAQTQKYQFKAISKRIDKFWKQASFNWVVVGNFDPAKVTNMTSAFENNIGASKKSGPADIRCLKINQNQQRAVHVTRLQSEDIGTSGCIVYFQVGPFQQSLYYKLRLLQTYIKQPFFNKLRTQQQLAYYVAAYRQINRSVLSLNFILVSSNAHPRTISGHIHNFISDFQQKIANDLTNQKLETLKNSVRTDTLQPHHNLKSFYNFVNNQVQTKAMNFKRKQKEQLETYLQPVTAQDLIDLLVECRKKCLEVWVVSKPHAEQFDKETVKETTVEQIRSNYQYHLDPKVKLSAE